MEREVSRRMSEEEGLEELKRKRRKILVLREDLEFLFSKDPEFMNLEELKRRREIKERYLNDE